MPLEEGVADGVEGDLDLPAFVVEPNQLTGRVAVVVEEGGDQSVPVPDAGAVAAGHGHIGLDHPYLTPTDDGQERAVGKVSHHDRATCRCRSCQQVRAGRGDAGDEAGVAEGPVGQHQHPWPEQPEQLLREGGFVAVAG